MDLEGLSDLCTPWCIRVAVTLRVAERLAAGLERVDDLAAAAGCDASALHHVLGHLVAKGVFEEPAPGRFALNDAARQLVEVAPFLSLDGIGGRMAAVWATLPQFVRTGKPAYAELFGRPFWDDLDAHAELAADFDALMGVAGHGPPDPDVPITGGWSPVRSVVDVGGGTGAMLAALLDAQPHLTGTLVDRPATVARAGPVLEAAGVADRATTAGQSFFDPLPPGADVYLLNKVLNDWPDEESVAILRRCADAARPHGRVVVMGGVVPDGAPRRLVVEMLLCGGRSNTVTEFGSLAAGAGLEVAAVTRTGSGRLVVECRVR